MNRLKSIPEGFALGILGWEADSDDTLAQLESVVGNIAHPNTFDFPVRYRRIKGACFETVVVRPSRAVCDTMISVARELEADGARAISTGCGFNALFQMELAASVNVPVFVSSLLQVPMVHRMLRRERSVGIITADSGCLNRAHLEGVGISEAIPVSVYGIEETGEFSKIRNDPRASLDAEKMKDEVVTVTRKLTDDHPETGAIVLECTDLPPFAAAVRKATGLPVFDIVTLTYWVMDGILGDRWSGRA